jgi:transposase-like protein
VRFYENSQKSMAEVERELGITPYLLSKWVRQSSGQDGAQAFPGKGKLTERDEEVRRGRLPRPNPACFSRWSSVGELHLNLDKNTRAPCVILAG